MIGKSIEPFNELNANRKLPCAATVGPKLEFGDLGRSP
jgi:hypothetical protein